jgi:hypothetical protein
MNVPLTPFSMSTKVLPSKRGSTTLASNNAKAGLNFKIARLNYCPVISVRVVLDYLWTQMIDEERA